MKPSIILCPVAYSRGGRSAIAQALAIARWFDAELHLLQLRGRRSASGAPVAMPLVEGRADSRLARLLNGLDWEAVNVSSVILRGDPVIAVGDYARRSGADLVVVARHGRPSGAYWRPGVYAADVARQVVCPTLAVPEARGSRRTTPAPFSSILCPTDFSPASFAALDHALVVAQQSGGCITLLHALERFPYETVYSGSRAFRLIGEYRERVRRIEGELRRSVPSDAFNWCEVGTRAVSGDAHRAIVATATEINADLIVMGLPHRSAWDRVVMGSTTMSVLRRASCPVLVVPANLPAGATSGTDVGFAGARSTPRRSGALHDQVGHLHRGALEDSLAGEIA